ncbi:unnamed protein product [Phytophthora fragariaefolia]|uniref:Unnamed protein product n=1 Tax=Phytophthora fragariaefolia TaxID=1490495 RepID=A0A9W6UBD7_9STRA|nr:unnamed protein product [Phytophthora fragariaefolia]
MRGETRVESWWSFNGDEDVMKPGTTYLSTNCDQYDRLDAASLATSDDGYPWRSMNGYSLPAESWMPLKGRKVCNRYGVPSTADGETSTERNVDVGDKKADVETLKYCENMRDARSMQ